MQKLSVVLATYNEAQNLSRCLTSIKVIANEIIIVDGQSTDNTVKIAKHFGAKVFLVPNQANFHINKNLAINHATGDWILQLDADEVVSPALSSEIKSTITHSLEVNGYWVNRKNWFLTRFLTKGGQYPDATLRLYRRGMGRLPALDVHEQAVVYGPTGHLTNDLLHYRDTSFEKYLDGFNRYSTLVSTQLSQPNIFNYLIIKPLTTFFTIYFRHLGLVDGMPGFIFALYSGLIYPVAYIKHWQHTKYPENTL